MPMLLLYCLAMLYYNVVITNSDNNMAMLLLYCLAML
jgi:hypothetical protein